RPDRPSPGTGGDVAAGGATAPAPGGGTIPPRPASPTGPHMAFFNLVLQTSGTLHPDGEPDDFISEHTGVIRFTRDNGQVVTVGKVKACLHADLAHEAGATVFDVCDAHSQATHDLYAALFDPVEDDLKEPIRGRFDAAESDVLVLDYILLSPRWRGL